MTERKVPQPLLPGLFLRMKGEVGQPLSLLTHHLLSEWDVDFWKVWMMVYKWVGYEAFGLRLKTRGERNVGRGGEEHGRGIWDGGQDGMRVLLQDHHGMGTRTVGDLCGLQTAGSATRTTRDECRYSCRESRILERRMQRRGGLITAELCIGTSHISSCFERSIRLTAKVGGEGVQRSDDQPSARLRWVNFACGPQCRER